MFDPNLISFFLQIVKAGSITVAAKKLHLTPSAIHRDEKFLPSAISKFKETLIEYCEKFDLDLKNQERKTNQ